MKKKQTSAHNQVLYTLKEPVDPTEHVSVAESINRH